jgi:Repeat of unknown function (DUF5648)
MDSHFCVMQTPGLKPILDRQEQNGWAVQEVCCNVLEAPGHNLIPLYSAFSPKLSANFYSQYVMDFEYCLYVQEPDYFPSSLVCYFPPQDPATTAVPLYMAYNVQTEDIVFTTDAGFLADLEAAGYSQVAGYGLLHGNLIPDGSPAYPYLYIYPEQVAGTVPLYQLLVLNHHLYLTDDNKRNTLVAEGAKSEGTIGYVYDPPPGPAPLYASVSPNKTFFYTMNLAEHIGAISDLGHKGQGIACYCFPTTQPQPANTFPLFRMYRQVADDHFYTADCKERDAYLALYNLEGTAAYVYAAGSNVGIPFVRLLGPSSTNIATVAGIGPVPGTCGEE